MDMDNPEEMDELINEFLIESYENLDRLDQELVELEKDPSNAVSMASVFRTIHTIKGTAGFFGFTRLGAVTHVGEHLLSRLRDGELHLTAEIASALLALVDAVRQMLSVIESTHKEDAAEYTDLIDLLSRLSAKHAANIAPPPAQELATQAPLTSAPAVQVEAAKPIPATPAVTPALATGLAGKSAVSSMTSAAAPVGQADTGKSSVAAENNIRVGVGVLDKLMNLVGELVLARNQVLQFTMHEDAAFAATSHRLNLVTAELQESVMKTRMQPIGSIWSKFPRVIRDLAMQCGKQVELLMEGNETELDRTIIEAIKDPLTHLIRNSVDHGIELPELRKAAGKSPCGRIRMRAYHEGGQVNIEISDDGGGIPVERVKQKAIEKGVLTAEQGARMSEREAFHLIFLPGFSTAEKLTNVSGRGVGMDVVKTNIERIGGSVDVYSRFGQSTDIRIKIPLTLAIVPGLIVTCGGDRYVIPQASLLELVRLEHDKVGERVEQIHGATVYRLRGNLLPIVYLERILELTSRQRSACEALNVVVLQAGEQSFGLVVDEVNDTEEIVVKALAKQLKGVGVFAGATIRGDGKVALILDVPGVAQRAEVFSSTRIQSIAPTATREAAAAQAQELLLFACGEQGRMALPLNAVARLEEIPRAQVERLGSQEVMQYRGQIVPLVFLSKLLFKEAAPVSTAAALQVVVCSHAERLVGLVVDNIFDIVHEAVVVRREGGRVGVTGSVVIQGRVTELLDIEAAVRLAQIEAPWAKAVA